jgi:hypothetical protein
VLFYLSVTRHVTGRGKVCTSLLAARSLCGAGSDLVIADLRGAEPHATAQTLPDDVLLEIFGYHRLASLRSSTWRWHRLAQVCRKWRFVVFAYPRRLDLRIVVTYDKSTRIRKIPNFWPTLPIIMWYPQSELHPFLSPKDEDNICDLLKNPARICEMHMDVTRSLLRKCAPLLSESFPALEHLRLKSHDLIMVFPDNFLDCSAPRLRVLHLDNTAFSNLPRLLSSSKNIVSLRLENISRQGFFMPEDLAIGLSTATQLESLKIHFCFFVVVTRPPRRDDLSSLPTRFVLPALIEFQYEGECTYLEDFASRIDAPIIEQIEVTFKFFYFFEYDVYELCALFGRGEELRSSRGRTNHIQFFEESVVFTHHFSRSPSSLGSFRLRLPFRSWDEHVSQICLGLQSWGPFIR